MTTATADDRLSGCRWTTCTSEPAAAAHASPADLRQEQEESDDDRQGGDQSHRQFEHGQLAAAVVDDLGDPEAEVLVDARRPRRGRSGAR